MKTKRANNRGIALLMVVGSVAMLTAVAVEFQYQSSVDLRLAINARDELRAEYMARSAINLSRLVLRFQRQVDSQTAALGPLLQQLGIGNSTGTTGNSTSTKGNSGTAGSGGGGLNIRLWEMVPVECGFFGMLFGDRKSGALRPPSTLDGPHSKADDRPSGPPGSSEGCFFAQIQDEEQKTNLNRLNGGAATGRPPALQAMLLLGDPRFEFVFDKTDANGVKMTPQEVLIALHDWIDEKDTQASFNVSGSGDPFPDGFGDENRNSMSRYPFRYRSKNASFDTLDEMYQVDGVSDLFMSAFRDRLTVYPDKNRLLNINTNDPVQQYVNIVTVAANENDPKLKNTAAIQSILQEIALTKVLSFLGMSTGTFISIVEKNGISVRPEIKTNVASNNWVGDKSETFTIKATGQVDKVERTITAVIRANDTLGKLLYYRME